MGGGGGHRHGWSSRGAISDDDILDIEGPGPGGNPWRDVHNAMGHCEGPDRVGDDARGADLCGSCLHKPRGARGGEGGLRVRHAVN